MIGLFDSGIGGLTVVREVMKQLPDYPLLYLGDTARTPYGNKSSQVVEAYGLEAAKFLVNKGAKVIVVACHTVSAVGLEVIKKTFPDVPVFDVIQPTISVINQDTKKERRVGIIGTRALVNSGIYQRLLTKMGDYKIIAQPAPLLVPLVEEGWLNKPETKRIIKNYLRPFKQAQIDTLVLACTHYPLLKGLISARVGKRVKVIDPAVETALALASWLYENKALAVKIKQGASHFYVTDYTAPTEAIACKWLNQKINLEKVIIN